MSARPKDPKSLDRRIRDCESQLKFLHEALEKFKKEPDRYKQIAGSLRILVCSTKKTNDPLLLDLLDHFGVRYEVHPDPDLPFPCPMVGDMYYRNPPSEDLSKLTLEEVWEYHRKHSKPVRLRDFINRGLAVFIAPYEFSYYDLIRTVAEQSGGAHEDKTIDKALLTLEQFVIGGYSGYGAPLRHAAELVLDAGKRLICHAEQYHNYKPYYFGTP